MSMNSCSYILARSRRQKWASVASRVRVLVTVLGIGAATLFGPVAGTAWASAGCTAASGGTPLSYFFEYQKVAVNQPFDAGEQITVTFSAYSNTGGSAIKIINVGQGSTSGFVTSGQFGSFTLSGPGTFGPFTVPAGGISRLSISIRSGDGTMTATGTVTCGPPVPTVTSISPATGPSAGGTAVTITGTNLTGATAVTIGGVAATGITVVNATTITATTPAHAAGPVDVVVTTPGGSATGTGIYTYVAAPTVTAISPARGPIAGGTPVTITGTNLTGATAVTFGGIAATGITVVNATTITATTPAHAAGAVDVIVTTPGGSGTGTAIYTYASAPTVTAISPATGPSAGGTAVTITGTNLTGATAVTIGGVAATGITVVNATTITAATPAHAAGPVDVVVTTPGGSGTGTAIYTYASAPTVTAISPANGPIAGGTPVTISGTNLTGAAAVTFGGIAATGITVVNATTITATTPTHAAGAVDVVVTTPGGTGTGTGIYSYVLGPTLTAISPPVGPTAGGTAVTITGTDLSGATAVTFSGVAATGITVLSATTITATTPAHAAGPVDIVVTTPGGSATGTRLYTYAGGPAVAAISPASGPTAGGTAVTITGTSLSGATSVTIGGVAATSITVLNSTTITATTSAHPAGEVDVTVTTPGGSGTGARLYTYTDRPIVTAVSPASGPSAGGTAVTITGTNLTGATAVTIGGAAATGLVVIDATTITATTPAHAAGTVNVVVTTPGGTGTGTGVYTYYAPLALVSVPSALTQVGQLYSQTNVASGGTPAYTYTVSAGSLPDGTSLSASTGLVSGTPVASGPFTYTIQVADGGAIPLTTTQLVTGVIAAIPTTTSLSSSLNPSLMSEPVALTATVTPASATGTVAFKDGAATLCTAVPLVSGVATCTTAFTASGAHPLTATYGGSAALAASTSEVLVQTVNDQRIKTVETIGRFMSRRNDLIAANEPDVNRQIDRLIDARRDGAGSSRASAGTGFVENTAGGSPNGGEGLPSELEETPGAGHFSQIGFGPRERRFAAAQVARQFPTSPSAHDVPDPIGALSIVRGPMRITATPDGARQFAFATSLSQMQGLGAAAPKFSRFDVSIEGKYGSFSDGRADADLDGHFGLLSIGADYVLGRTLLVGVVGQFDSMRQESNVADSEASGRGWVAGPYATVRLTENLFLQGRAAWGGSSNEVRPFETYTDEFDTDRWLVSSRLTGHWGFGGWVFRPSVAVAHIEDVAGSYTDRFGVVIPKVRSRLGQARVGPEISYRHQFRPDVVLEPRAGLQLISRFAGDTTASGLGQINGENVGPLGTRSRAEIGFRLSTPRGIGVNLAGSYDGIGINDYSAFTGQVMVRVPVK